MQHSDLFGLVEGILLSSLGTQVELRQVEVQGGGCINRALKIIAREDTYFLKCNENSHNFFDHEVSGLQLLASSQTFRIPEVINAGVYGDQSYLLMEYIKPGYGGSNFWRDFGRQLAELHQLSSDSGLYGLGYDNEIGRLQQKNDWMDNWIEFFIQNRLEAQLTLAYYNGHIDEGFMRRFRELYGLLPSLLVGGKPSLLHGDLWSGNFLVGENGEPVLIDPAVYYGHREVELAYTRLFGGFNPDFYESYNASWPLQPEFEERVDLYNLYPLLVHVNLFGASYLSGIEQTLRRHL